MSDVYTIGMRIVLAGNAAHGLQQIMGLLGGIHGHVNNIHKGFRGWAAILGVGAVGTGMGIIGGLKTALDHAKELSRELAITQSFNLSPGEAFRVNQEARRIGSGGVTGVTQSGAQRIFNQIYPLAGVDHGIEAMDSLSRASKLLGFITHDREGAGKSLLEVVKSAELGGRFSDPTTGHFDKQKFDEFLSLIVKWSDATHGVVGPKQIYQLFQQGAPALKNMSLEGMGSMFGAVLDMGGQRAGTALSSVFTQFFGDVMTKPKAEELQKLGILKKFTSDHGHISIPEDGWNESFRNVLRKDPLMASQKLFEMMGLSPEKAQEELFKVFGRITSSRLFSDLMANFLQKIQERARVSGVQDMNAMEKNIDNNDVETAEINLKNAYKSLWESIAGPMATTGILNLNSLTHALEDLTKYVNTIPAEKLQDIFNSLKVLGLTLVGAGGAALLAALGPVGWMVLGVGAMTAVFIAFRKEIIESEFARLLGEEFKAISSYMQVFLDTLKPMWEGFRDWMLKMGFWGKGTGPTAPPGGGSYDAMGNYTPSAYHPGGGANDNYSSLGGGYAGGVAGSAKGAALIARLVKEDGLTPEQAAGIVGNLGHESGGFRHFKELGGGGLGWAQWTGVRARAFLSWSKRHGLDPHSDEANWGFLHADPEWKRAIGAVRGTHSTADAMLAFEHSYERAGIKAYGSRLGHGRSALHEYSSRSKKAIEEGVTPPPRRSNEIHVHNTTTLDGEVVARNTTRKQSQMAYFPTSDGDIDVHGRYHHAGTRMADVG